MALHEVIVFGIGINNPFNLHDTVIELTVLSIIVMRVATWQDLLAEFEENGMLTLAADGGDHLLITLGSVALKILKSKSGGHRGAYTGIGKADDMADETVEMTSPTHLGIGGLVEAVDADLDLADIRRKVVNQLVVPKDAIGEDGGGESLTVGMFEDVLKIGIHEWFATSEGDALTTLLAEIGQDATPFLFGKFVVEGFAGTHETMLATEVTGIGEVAGELMSDIRHLRLRNMVGQGKRAGSDGSKELFEFCELLFGGDELADFADGLAVDEMFQKQTLEICGQYQPVGCGNCHCQPSFVVFAKDYFFREEEPVGAFDLSALLHRHLCVLQIVFQGLRPWNTTQLGGTIL